MTDASRDAGALGEDQLTGRNDMDPEAFRAAAHVVVDRIADYLATSSGTRCFPAIEPGSLAPLLPAAAPERPGVDGRDPRRLRPPHRARTRRTGSTRASSPISRRRASGPGILGEMLTAALGQNPMLWRTSPIGTELEERRRRLAAPGARPAGRVRRAADRHGLDVDAHRARRRARGRGPGRLGRRARGPRTSARRASTPPLRRTARSRRRA